MRKIIVFILASFVFCLPACAQFASNEVESGISHATACRSKFAVDLTKQANCLEQVENIYLPNSFPYTDLLLVLQHARLQMYAAVGPGLEAKNNAMLAMSQIKSQFQKAVLERLQHDETAWAKGLKPRQLDMIFAVVQP